MAVVASPRPSTSPSTTCSSTTPPYTTLTDVTPRRPFRQPQDAPGDRLAAIAELDDHDLGLVTAFIDALVTKTRLKHLASRAC